VFRFVGGALSKKKAVTFKTPVATIGIRGGIGVITVDAETGKTDAAFLYGTEMTVTNSTGTVQTTVPGTMVSTLSATQSPNQPVKVDDNFIASTSDSLNLSENTEQSGDETNASNDDGTSEAGSEMLSQEAAAGSDGTATGGVDTANDAAATNNLTQDAQQISTSRNAGQPTMADAWRTAAPGEAVPGVANRVDYQGFVGGIVDKNGTKYIEGQELTITHATDSGDLQGQFLAGTTVPVTTFGGHAANDVNEEIFNGNDRQFTMNQDVGTGSIIAGADNPLGDGLGCSSCEFVDWGVWSGNFIATDTYTMQNVAFIYGLQTLNDQLPTTGSATYSGAVIGQIHDNGSVADATGAFSAGVDFANRRLNAFNMNIGDIQFNAAAGTLSTTGYGTAGLPTAAQFTNVTISGAEITGGVCNAGACNGANTFSGAFYGPSGENMGGNFSFTNTGGTVGAAGVYLGAQQ